MRLGVLGGTFDPVHIGHLVLAETARHQLKLEKVLFVPAGDPWRKPSQAVSSAAHRLRMTELAIEGNTDFGIDTSEIEREGPSYTVETLAALRRQLSPDDELYFLLGEDALADLPHWRDPARIAELAQIAVAPRQGSILVETLPFPRERLIGIEMPYIGVSSTSLRERAERGLSLRYLVPAAVELYILENRLYGAP
jgi:nicotinate-nucleotide adenylyltransferase